MFKSAARGAALLLSAWLMIATMASAQHTYYVSKSTGSDSNGATQAQSKTSPWAHFPGMASCTSNCKSYSPLAGDRFILMGCDTWVNSDLPVNWNWSGTSGAPIYIGVDKTWYNATACPSGWNRPIWDAQKDVISGGNFFFYPSPSGSTNYVTLDNIEMTHLEITSGSYGSAIGWVGSASQGWTFSNNYIHAWDASADNCVLIQGTYEGSTSQNDIYEDNVIDGSDATGPGMGGGVGTCYGFYTDYSGVKIVNNVIRYVVNPIVAYSGSNGLEIGGNLIEYGQDSLGGANHCNMIEIVGGGTFYIHDNVIHDMACNGGEFLMLGNNGETSYVWNNIMYNISPGQPPSFPQTGGQGTIPGLYFYGNTIVTGTNMSCFNYSGQTGSTFTHLVMENNHCVTTSESTYSGGASVTNLVQTPNTLMTPTTATSQGYTSSETYAYSPTKSSGGTVGAGTNLTSSCSGNLSGLCNDTGYAVLYNSASQTVTVPARTETARPTTGAWDAGAYLFGDDPPPDPPSELAAVAH